MKASDVAVTDVHDGSAVTVVGQVAGLVDDRVDDLVYYLLDDLLDELLDEPLDELLDELLDETLEESELDVEGTLLVALLKDSEVLGEEVRDVVGVVEALLVVMLEADDIVRISELVTVFELALEVEPVVLKDITGVGEVDIVVASIVGVTETVVKAYE